MPAKSKQVILFLVEGSTDEDALSPVLKKLFHNTLVRFHVVNGDISTDLSVDSRNAVNTVNNHIKREMTRYGFRRGDLIRIIHLIDTDGAFIPNDHVEAGDVPRIQYEENCILTKQVPQTVARNERKQRVINKLCSTKKVGGTPYQVYYFSRNLEHVLHNDNGSLTDEEKIACADEFADTYTDDPQGFVQFLMESDFTVSGDYSETWEFIFAGTNSLHRHCNIHLMLADIHSGSPCNPLHC